MPLQTLAIPLALGSWQELNRRAWQLSRDAIAETGADALVVPYPARSWLELNRRCAGFSSAILEAVTGSEDQPRIPYPLDDWRELNRRMSALSRYLLGAVP